MPNQVYTLSSETDRTIMTAQLSLAGLFPVNNVTNWDTSVNWQPIPLRTVSRKQDNVSDTNKIRCGRCGNVE